MNFFKSLFGAKKTNVEEISLPFRFVTKFPDESKMESGYSFTRVNENEKIFISFFFRNLTYRLQNLLMLMKMESVGLDKLNKYKPPSKGWEVRDRNKTVLVQVLYEVCMYDFETFKMVTTKTGRNEVNIFGSIRDTIYWTFILSNIHLEFYKSYKELESDKLDFWNKFVREYNYLEMPDIEMAETLYYKILDIPCCPFLISYDFFGKLNPKRLDDTAKFAAFIKRGQREFIMSVSQ